MIDFKQAARWMTFALLFTVAVPIGALPPADDELSEAEELSNQGALLAQEGNYKIAVERLERAVRLDPQFAVAWYNLALAHQRLEAHASSAVAFETVVSLLPDHADAWYHLGVARSRLGHHKDAVVALYRSRELKPNDPRPLIQLGYEAWHLNNWGSALEHWAEFLKRFPDDPNVDQISRQLPGAFYNLARERQSEGRWAEAMSTYQKVLELRPDSPKALYNLGLILHTTGAPDKARRVLALATELDPKNPDLLHLMATVSLAQDSLSAADAHLTRALEISPNHEGARMGRAALQAKEGNQDEALKTVRNLVGESPDDPKRHALLAYVYEHNAEGQRYGSGFNSSGAIKTYRKALHLAPGTVEYHYNLGIVLGHAQEWADARAEFHQVLRADSTHAGVRQWLPVVESNLEVQTLRDATSR